MCIFSFLGRSLIASVQTLKKEKKLNLDINHALASRLHLI